MSRIVVMVLLLSVSSALGQYYGDGDERSFALERWEEDYTWLKDSPERRKPLNAVKYVPLNQSGDAYLSFGGSARYRYDYFNNPTFGPGINDGSGFHLQRYLAHIDAHVGEHLRGFVEVNSSFVDGRKGGGRYGDAEHFDLQQGFVDISTSKDANPFAYLRIGRQELIYGAQRFVSPDDWRNVRRTFDGVKVSASVPNDTIEAFVTRPVLIERDQFNNDDPGSLFAGAYNVLALPRVISGSDTKVDTYFLYLGQTADSFSAVEMDLYTVGARFHTKPGYFDIDIESNYQFGNIETGGGISAWSFATEAGYTFEPYPLSPRLFVGFDMASGSPESDGRFNQLFPPTYMYLGHLYLFGRTNLLDAHAGVNFHLTKGLTLHTSHHTFWRQNTDDALYNLSGGVVRADNGSDAAYVGNELDIALYWQINRYLSAYVGWAHFFSGDFLQETGPAEDVTFFYASGTLMF